MSFDALIEKVRQAEQALEASERRTLEDWQRFRQAWRSGWTPARIVVAGVVAGFAVGRVQPLRAATGGGVLQVLTALSGLVASGSAQAAAAQAGQAAEAAGTASGDAAAPFPQPPSG
ncbi:MAG: hypothetical protein IPF45_09570 [Thermomonas sp.]|jgi:hypothetical protein|nr:hypothetical protein [Thermomonas sp.]HQY81813.1 hypothetical protein [Thermomonas sp.]